MARIHGDYAKALARLKDERASIFQPLLDRLQQAGLCFHEDRIVDSSGTELEGAAIPRCVAQFIRKTNCVEKDGSVAEYDVRRPLMALADELEDYRRDHPPTPPIPPAPASVSALPTSPSSSPPVAITEAANLATSASASAPEASASAIPLSLPPVAAASTDTSKIPETASAAQIALASPSLVTLAKSEPPPPPKPATWQVKEPSEPWAPETIAPHLGFSVEYKHAYCEKTDASPAWRVIAATRRGRMHAHEGTHREDAFHFIAEEHFTIICVCDGAGAYEYSRIGSEVTSRDVVSLVTETLSSRRAELAKLDPAALGKEMQGAIGVAVARTCDRLNLLAEKSGAKPKDFRCTLLLGVLWLGGEVPYLFFSQVGDGFLASQSKEGTALRHGKSDSGEFSGEVNCFVPDPEAPRNAQHVEQIDATNVDAFIFCSDGIEDPFYPIEKQAGVIFAQLRDGVSEPLAHFKQSVSGPVIGAPDGGEQLERWLEFEKKGENDDRTILILHRSPSALAKAPPARALVARCAATATDP